VAACVWLKWGLSDRPLERRWRTLARRHPPLHPGQTHTQHTQPLRHGLGEERGAAYLCMATWRSRSAAVALPVDALDMLGSR
jgi:hypothetical protein